MNRTDETDAILWIKPNQMAQSLCAATVPRPIPPVDGHHLRAGRKDSQPIAQHFLLGVKVAADLECAHHSTRCFRLIILNESRPSHRRDERFKLGRSGLKVDQLTLNDISQFRGKSNLNL